MNVQFASDGDAQMVVAVEVTSQGSDSGLMGPMYKKIRTDYASTPDKYLVAGGFTHRDDVTDQKPNCRKPPANKKIPHGKYTYPSKSKKLTASLGFGKHHFAL